MFVLFNWEIKICVVLYVPFSVVWSGKETRKKDTSNMSEVILSRNWLVIQVLDYDSLSRVYIVKYSNTAVTKSQ